MLTLDEDRELGQKLDEECDRLKVVARRLGAEHDALHNAVLDQVGDAIHALEAAVDYLRS